MNQGEPAVHYQRPQGPPPHRAGLLTAAVGLAALFLGYVLGASGTPASAPAGSAALNGAVPTAGSLAAEPSASTIATTTSSTLAPERDRLFTLVPPLLRHRLVGISDQAAFVWRAGAPEPDYIELPVSAIAEWHDTGRHLAYLAYEPAAEAYLGNELWIAYEARAPQPAWVGVLSFAFHPTKEQIGWIGVAPPATTLHAFAGTLTYFGVDDIEVVDTGLPIPEPFSSSLVAFSDEGWVINWHRPESPAPIAEETVTVLRSGEPAGSRPGSRALTLSPDGHVLLELVDDWGTTVWTDFSLRDMTPASIDGWYFGFDWARDGLFVATRSGPGGGIGLFRYDGGDTAVELPLAVSGGSGPGISPDGGLVVTGTALEPGSTRISVYDPGSRRGWTVSLEGAWFSLDVGSG